MHHKNLSYLDSLNFKFKCKQIKFSGGYVFGRVSIQGLLKEVKSRKVENIIEDLVRKYNPSKIFTHSHDDIIFVDHKAVSNVVMKALKKIKYQGDVYIFDIWNPMTIRKRHAPKMIVDVSETFKIKEKALGCFKSQSFVIAELKPLIYARAIKNGIATGVRFAEKFYRAEL